MNYLEWLVQAAQELSSSDSPKRDAEILLEFVTTRPRTFIIAFGETELTIEQIRMLDYCLIRRKNGEPVAYIIGQKEFWSLPLNVSTETLIPRSDTERLVELALERLPAQSCDILDLGTGTGAIALAIASERPDCFVTGVDLKPSVVELATSNKTQLDIQNVEFLHGSWFQPVAGKHFAMIVSNPPYIDENDEHLLRGDVRFEPRTALVAKEKGLADIRYIIEHAKPYLCQYGWLLIEHGWQQAREVRRIFKREGYELVETFQDYSDNDRITLGRYFRFR